jgi:hypothetical protein
MPFYYARSVPIGVTYKKNTEKVKKGKEHIICSSPQN